MLRLRCLMRDMLRSERKGRGRARPNKKGTPVSFGGALDTAPVLREFAKEGCA